MRICLDPGHGFKRGMPTGAAANGLKEDVIALEFVNRIGHYLRAAGHTTVVTRGQDWIGLKDRARIAKKAPKCDLFLSIHCNAGQVAAHGAEAFIVDGHKSSELIAKKLLNVMEEHIGHSRGVKPDNKSQYSSLTVLRDTYNFMPAILLELGFITNPNDAKKLADRHWREDVACEMARVLTAK
jgi:N-acetylmuramoyl-L-alanine amidase